MLHLSAWKGSVLIYYYYVLPQPHILVYGQWGRGNVLVWQTAIAAHRSSCFGCMGHDLCLTVVWLKLPAWNKVYNYHYHTKSTAKCSTAIRIINTLWNGYLQFLVFILLWIISICFEKKFHDCRKWNSGGKESSIVFFVLNRIIFTAVKVKIFCCSVILMWDTFL